MHTLERNSIVACGSSWRLILALASPLALMVPAVAVTGAVAGHAIAPESQVDWRTHLTKVDDAVGKSDVPVAVLRWPTPTPPRCEAVTGRAWSRSATSIGGWGISADSRRRRR